MGNCFFEKLKVSVDADLEKYGVLGFTCTPDLTKITVKAGTVVNGSNLTMKIGTSEDVITTFPHTVPGTDYADLILRGQNDNGKCEINDYYNNLRNINPSGGNTSIAGLYNFPLEGIRYAMNLRKFDGNDATGTKFLGTINIKDIVSESLEVFSTNAGWMRGYIQDFRSIVLSKIELNTGKVYGSIEALAEKQLSNGRTSGSIAVNCANCSNILFHSNAVGQNVVIVFGTNSATVKTADQSTTLATYNGSTWTYA